MEICPTCGNAMDVISQVWPQNMNFCFACHLRPPVVPDTPVLRVDEFCAITDPVEKLRVLGAYA
jgi:hypothetical protein